MGYGPFIVMILHRIIWGLVKGVFLVLIIYHLFSSVLFYPTFVSDGITFGGIVSWVSQFVKENWLYLVGIFVLYYSWSISRKVRAMEGRVEQIEVISFAETKYFNFWPETEIIRTAETTDSFSDLAKSYVVGWVASLFNVNNPKDLPWSAKPVRDGEEVSIIADIQGKEDKDE